VIKSDPRYRRHPKLLVDQLEGLRAQWVRLGAPIERLLRPGLEEAEMDSMAAAHNLRLPPELRIWWNWHDGTADGPDEERSIGPGSYVFLSLAEALEAYEQNRQIHHPEPDMGDMFWHDSWLPFMNQQAQRLYVDCDRLSQIGDSPIRLVSWEWEDFDVDRANSLGHAVSMWTWLLSSDFYRWNGELWECDFVAIPAFVRVTGMA
jgi:hypothetical protein